jgi:Rod binding domain-containing protein
MTSPVSPGSSQPQSREEFKKLYQQAIGGTFFRQMMKALRSSTGNAAYFNGGQAEKIFQGQLDELMIEKLSETSGGIFSDIMFEQQFPELANDDATESRAENSKSSPDDALPPGESTSFDATA